MGYLVQIGIKQETAGLLNIARGIVMVKSPSQRKVTNDKIMRYILEEFIKNNNLLGGSEDGGKSRSRH